MFSMFSPGNVSWVVLIQCFLSFRANPPPVFPRCIAHPNPIITFVELKDFKPASPDRRRKETGIELLGLSQDEGKRESVELRMDVL